MREIAPVSLKIRYKPTSNQRCVSCESLPTYLMAESPTETGRESSLARGLRFSMLE